MCIIRNKLTSLLKTFHKQAVEDTKDPNKLKNPTHLWGNLDVQEFVKKLKEVMFMC